MNPFKFSRSHTFYHLMSSAGNRIFFIRDFMSFLHTYSCCWSWSALSIQSSIDLLSVAWNYQHNLELPDDQLWSRTLWSCHSLPNSRQIVVNQETESKLLTWVCSWYWSCCWPASSAPDAMDPYAWSACQSLLCFEEVNPHSSVLEISWHYNFSVTKLYIPRLLLLFKADFLFLGVCMDLLLLLLVVVVQRDHACNVEACEVQVRVCIHLPLCVVHHDPTLLGGVLGIWGRTFEKKQCICSGSFIKFPQCSHCDDDCTPGIKVITLIRS